MRNKSKLLKKFFAAINCIVLTLVAQTANTTCIWIFHQPEFPETAHRYIKIKK